MDEVQRIKAANWFAAHLSPVCPSCQRPAGFSVLEKLCTPNLYGDAGQIMLGGPAIPLVGVACTNCYNIRFFSAIMMGVVERKTAIEVDPEAAKS